MAVYNGRLGRGVFAESPAASRTKKVASRLVKQVKKDQPTSVTMTQLRQIHRYYFASVLVDTIGLGMWIPISLIFFTRAAHIQVNQVGVAITLGGIVGLLCGPIGGTLVDRWGPAPFALLSMLIRAVVFVCYPFVSAAWQVAILSAVFAASDRLFWTSNTPLLDRLASGRELESLLGTQSMVRVIGIGIGAAVSAGLAGSVLGLHILTYCNAASYVIALIALWLGFKTFPALRGKKGGGKGNTGGALSTGNWRTVLADRPYVLLCFVQQLFIFGSESLVVILPLVAVNTLRGAAWLAGGSILAVTLCSPLCRSPRSE